MEDKITLVQKGKLHFRWKNGDSISIDCIVSDGELVEHDDIEINLVDQFNLLESVQVEYSGQFHPLCLECQSHLVKTRTTESPIGSGFFEEGLECSNPNCTNKL